MHSKQNHNKLISNKENDFTKKENNNLNFVFFFDVGKNVAGKFKFKGVKTVKGERTTIITFYDYNFRTPQRGHHHCRRLLLKRSM